MRDIKLVAFLVDKETGIEVGDRTFPHQDESIKRLATLGGISRERVTAALARLLDAGALMRREGDPVQLAFAERVLGPAGVAEYIDWPAVSARLHGRTPALLLLRSVLDAMRAPWDWASLTYDVLGEQSYYSPGMARHGVGQLLQAGVLERNTHAGRGHEYRCSPWALGQTASQADLSPLTGRALPVEQISASDTRTYDLPSGRMLQNATRTEERVGPSGHRQVAVDSELRVEIGGLVLRLPVGTEIRMRVGDDGAPIYEVGPHLRFSQGAAQVADR